MICTCHGYSNKINVQITPPCGQKNLITPPNLFYYAFFSRCQVRMNPLALTRMY